MSRLMYVCKYTPVELLVAYGATPQLLDVEPENFDLSDRVAHPNLCGYGKSILQAVEEGNVHELVLVNCCDVIRSVYDLLLSEKKLDFLYFLDLPHETGGCFKERMKTELVSFAHAYGAYTGQSFDKEAFFRAFSDARAKKEASRVTSDESYISVLGAHTGAGLYQMIRDAMPLDTANESCAGNRFVACPEDASDFDELMEHYADELLAQIPCMRMSEDVGRRELYNRANLKGVVYHTMKFCDYYGFEYATLRNTLAVPMVKIESDGTRQSFGQLQTRLEAFAEEYTIGMGDAMRNSEMKSKQKADAIGTQSQNECYYAGIDSGSTSTDVVIMNQDKTILSRIILPTGAGASDGAAKALALALDEAGLSEGELTATVATGYGRSVIDSGDKSVTEITCHARGAHFLDPDVRTVIDIGGQDSKVIRMDENGKVESFVMNDKCAAGTGRFLEMMARTLQISMEEISRIGLTWEEDITISSMCTVFADSEVVSLVAQNKALPDIVHGLNKSVAAKATALYHRVQGTPVVMMTGGVAQNEGVVRALEESLGTNLVISEDAQLCGAIGAALFASEMS